MRPYHSLTLLPLCCAAAATTNRHPARQSVSNATAPADLLYQYAPVTWVENIAVRPNGWLLPVTITSPVLNQLNPTISELLLVHDFSAAGNAIDGITDILPDLFAVDVLRCNITAIKCTTGSVSTWTVDFRSHVWSRYQDGPEVKEITTLPDAKFLDGMATLSAREGLVIIADSYRGGIWRVNIWTGTTELIFTDPSMSPTANATAGVGVNGIRVRPGELYFTNSAMGTLNRVPIDAETGVKTGNVTVIASGLANPDDFEVDLSAGVAYVCAGAANQLLRVALAGGQVDVVASLPGPTSARWAAGRHADGRVLYVTTTGGLLQYVRDNVTTGGAVYEVVV